MVRVTEDAELTRLAATLRLPGLVYRSFGNAPVPQTGRRCGFRKGSCSNLTHVYLKLAHINVKFRK